MHADFRKRIELLSAETRIDSGITAVLTFLEHFTLDNLNTLPSWPDIATTNPVMSFRLHGDLELVCQRPAVAKSIAVEIGGAPDGFCLISGAPAVIERLHSPIKGVWDKPKSTPDKNIISINNKNEGGINTGQTPAFASYGKQQGYTSPTGKPAAFAYTTALNHLLARGSRQRIQIGDTSTVFWAEAPHELETTIVNLFDEPSNDNPDRNTDAVKALYASVESG